MAVPPTWEQTHTTRLVPKWGCYTMRTPRQTLTQTPTRTPTLSRGFLGLPTTLSQILAVSKEDMGAAKFWLRSSRICNGNDTSTSNKTTMTRQFDSNWQVDDNEKTTRRQQDVEDKTKIQLGLTENAKNIARKGNNKIFCLLEVFFRLYLVASPFLQAFCSN